MLRYHAPGDPWRARLSVQGGPAAGWVIMDAGADAVAVHRPRGGLYLRAATRESLRAEREAERATWSPEKRAARDAANERSKAWHARQRPAPVGTAAAALQQIRAERAARR